MELLTMELVRYTAYAAWNPILIAIGFFVAFCSAVVFLACIEVNDTALPIISSIICFLLGLSVGMYGINYYNNTKKEMGYYVYQAIVDTYTREEIEENYLIVETSGKLYTLKDKEHFEVE